MTKEETKEAIKVMQAFADGATIQIKGKYTPWIDLDKDEEISWDWSSFNYRVKPEPTYRPYYDADEMDAAINEHGMVVKVLTGIRRTITYYDNQGFCTSKGHEVNDYSELLKWFRWLDGSPCGVKEE